MNILACSAGNPSCVLDVIDCTNHVAKGNTKDAFYICQQMLHHMHKINHDNNCLISLHLMELQMFRRQGY